MVEGSLCVDSAMHELRILSGVMGKAERTVTIWVPVPDRANDYNYS